MLNLNKKDTQVSKNGYDSSNFEFRILDESALKDVKGLQSEILDELGPEQTFITENTDEDFKGYLSGKKGKILGVYDKENGKLFGMVILKSSYVPDVSFDHIGDKNINCMGGLLVHKDYRGHSIGSILISKMKEMTTDTSDFVAYVDAQNPKSYIQFLKNGFGISHAYYDPEFQSPSYALVFTQDDDFKNNLYYPQKYPSSDILTFKKIEKILFIKRVKEKSRKYFLQKDQRGIFYPFKNAFERN